MTSRTPHTVSLHQASLDLSSICVLTLIRGLHLLRFSDNTPDLARIAGGGYRLLPYALEFWIEHCSRYANLENSSWKDSPLVQHLNHLHDTHEQLSTDLNRAKDAHSSDTNASARLDDRMKSFAHMPAHELMIEILRIRRLASQSSYEDGKSMRNLWHRTRIRTH